MKKPVAVWLGAGPPPPQALRVNIKTVDKVVKVLRMAVLPFHHQFLTGLWLCFCKNKKE
jgi:hypothetical protein